MEKLKDKNSIVYNNITDTLDEYKDEINLFIEKLGSEKKYFDITTERIMKSVIVSIATDNNKIFGISGIERKYGVLRNYIILLKEYHRGRFGTQLYLHMLEEAKTKCNIIMSVVKENNIVALKAAESQDFRKSGKRGNLYYLWKPLNTKGVFIFYLIKILFPLVKIVDIFRR